jgi:hypothetical protein
MRENEFLRLGLGEGGCVAGGENAGQASAGAKQRSASEGNAARQDGWHQVSSGCFLLFIIVMGQAGMSPSGLASLQNCGRVERGILVATFAAAKWRAPPVPGRPAFFKAQPPA